MKANDIAPATINCKLRNSVNLIAVDIDNGHITGMFTCSAIIDDRPLIEPTDHREAFVLSPDRNAGQAVTYRKQPDGTWLHADHRILLLARV